MEWLEKLIAQFGQIFKWYFMLMPWEQALRVRAGKYITKFEGGIHFKIPYLDKIFAQNTRSRVAATVPQTVTTLDNKTITLAGGLVYKIQDVEPLYQELHMAEDTIKQKVQSIISSYIAWNVFEECSPSKIMEHVKKEMDLTQWGLSSGDYIITDFAVVKTYRFITGAIEKWTNGELYTAGPTNSGNT